MIFSGKRILVTGSSGFVGKNLVERLKNEDVEVVSLTDQNGDKIDIRNWQKIKAIYGIEGIYHLAAVTYVPYSFENPRETYDVNVLGTLNMLELCRLRDVEKIVLVSSMTKKEVFSRFFMSKDKPVDFSLVGMINKRYISAIIKEAKIEDLVVGDKIVMYGDFGLDVYWVETIVDIDYLTSQVHTTYDQITINVLREYEITGVYVQDAEFMGTVYYSASFLEGFIFLTISHGIILFGYYFMLLYKKDE